MSNGENSIYKTVYDKYMEFYLTGNKELLEEVKALVSEHKLDISEQDLLWWKSYKYEKWAEKKGIY